MKKFKIYYEYANDEVYTTYKLGKSKEDVAKRVAAMYGLGKDQIIKVVDVTEEFPIDTDLIIDLCKQRGFGKPELDLIHDALLQLQ